MKILRSTLLPVFLCVLLWPWQDLRGQITGGMLNPEIDKEDEPFSYFWHPTDIIGALYAPAASEVTPEGYINTGFGELMFFAGNPPEPVEKRIKTLYKGYLPIVQYDLRRHGVRYRFTMFGADLGKELEGLPVNFVKVELENEAHEQRTAFLSSAYRYSAPISKLGGLPDYRFRQVETEGARPTVSQELELIPRKYVQGQDPFDPSWRYSFSRNSLVRDGRLIYTFSTDPQPHQISLALGDNGLRAVRYFTGEVRATSNPSHTLDPHTPMGVVLYRLPLQPGDRQGLVFKLPVVPLPTDSAEARLLYAADYETEFQRTISIWEDLVVKNVPLRFPEQKVQEYLLANTISILLAIDKAGDDYFPNVNKFQYHSPYGGSDTAHMMVALDYMGLEAVTRRPLLYSLKMQQPDGYFVMARHPDVRYWELFGYNLWAWGRHYLLTRDRDFLDQVYPGVQRAIDWLERITQEDSAGILPTSEIADDAFLKDARQTGQQMWILIGLKNAIAMAEGIGNEEDVARFERDYRSFWEAFERQLSTQTAQSNGYIPPAIERTLEGNDWDNLLMLYPEPLFDPFDSRVTATLEYSRSQYVEGILDFVLPRAVNREEWPGEAGQAGSQPIRAEGYVFETKQSLHYWHTPDNAQNAVVRGSPEDQIVAVKDLYALLLHTSSTHAPGEFGTYPWSTRDLLGSSIHDILPDGPASGKTIELLRNMLVREYNSSLYLFSAVSPAWLEAGETIEVRDEPTAFGPVSFVSKANSRMAEWNWEINLKCRFWSEPEKVIIRVPWFYELDRAEADKKRLEPTGGELILPRDVQEVRIKGRIRPGTLELSFKETVKNYKREYRQRYQEFLRTGETP